MTDRKRTATSPESLTTPADSDEGSSSPVDKRQKTEDQHVGNPRKALPEQIKVEERGMSVNQLIEIVDIITQRCNVERWTSTKDGMCC